MSSVPSVRKMLVGLERVLDGHVLARSCGPLGLLKAATCWRTRWGRSVCTCVHPSVTPGTAAHQAPLFTGLFRQECWNGFPFPPPGDLPHPGIEPGSLSLQADSLPTELSGKPEMRGLAVRGGSPEGWRAPDFRGSSGNSISRSPFPGWQLGRERGPWQPCLPMESRAESGMSCLRRPQAPEVGGEAGIEVHPPRRLHPRQRLLPVPGDGVLCAPQQPGGTSGRNAEAARALWRVGMGALPFAATSWSCGGG